MPRTFRSGAKDGNCKPSRRSNDLRHHQKEVYTNTNEATSATPAQTYAMLEHLINGEFEPSVVDMTAATPLPFAEAAPADIIDAQVQTANWLKELELDDDEAESKADAQAARQSFANLVTGQPTQNTQQALANIKAPAAVQHLVGMLTAYDWAFVEQARELRGYAVAQILEEVKHPDARIRLKALQMLGTVTEVALFTERVEVKKETMSDVELETRIKEKLNRFMGVIDVVDVTEEKSDEA
jgi:hypothetical protein